jgi:aryl-alcohol dehydrogenase-like predicted oxidoreductase
MNSPAFLNVPPVGGMADSQAYGPLTNEHLLGRALAGKRDQIILATKFGFDIRDGKVAGTNSRPTIIV